MSRNLQTGRIEEICIVITADCDISKGKFGRQLASLRVARLDDYFRTVWADKKLRKLIGDEGEKLRAQIAKWHSRTLGAESELTRDAVIAWVKREEPAALCATLQIPTADLKKATASVLSAREALRRLEQTSAADKLTQYVTYRGACFARDIAASRQEVLQAFRRETLPEDVFFLPTLPQLEIGPGLVMLRELVSVPREAVRYRTLDVDSDDAFLRIGRLKPTFKYALSQAFGGLYARIGLPDHYEKRCREALETTDYDWEQKC